jgi:hypothetical protein
MKWGWSSDAALREKGVERRGEEMGRPYEQVLEVGGGDVVLGLVGGEEAEVADHVVAAPQQVDPPADPFLPSKTEHVRRNSANRGMAIGEGGGVEGTWSREELEASAWRWDALSKRAGSGRSPVSSAAWRRSCASILLPTSSTSVIWHRAPERERERGEIAGG